MTAFVEEQTVKTMSMTSCAVLGAFLLLTGCSPETTPMTAHAAAVTVDAEKGDLASISPLSADEATYAANKDLVPAAIQHRLEVIDGSYAVGQLLSAEDAEFVRIFAMPSAALISYDEGRRRSPDDREPDVQLASAVHALPASSNSFNAFNSGAGGSGTVRGTQTMNYSDNPLNFTGHWSAQWRASGSASVNRITATEHVRVYGLIGGSGIGVAYAADPSGTVNGRTNYFSRSATFTAYGAYSTMNYDATFFTPSGSFNVTGK